MAIEGLRKNVVNCMRTGQKLIINLDKFKPNFTKDFTNEHNLPDNIFEQEIWAERETHMKIVKPDENHCLGSEGDMANFVLRKGFNIFILFCGPLEEVAELTETIPFFEKFKKLRVV